MGVGVWVWVWVCVCVAVGGAEAFWFSISPHETKCFFEEMLTSDIMAGDVDGDFDFSILVCGLPLASSPSPRRGLV